MSKKSKVVLLSGFIELHNWKPDQLHMANALKALVEVSSFKCIVTCSIYLL